MVGGGSLVDAVEGKVRLEGVLHGHCTPRINREADFRFVVALDCDLAFVNHAAVDIGPADGEFTFAGGARVEVVDGGERGIALDGGWKRQFATERGWARGRNEA